MIPPFCPKDGSKLNMLGNCTAPEHGKPCPTCQNMDGSVNEAWARENGSCTLCGREVIDPDHPFCSRSRDHSANRAQCEDCQSVYEDWAYSWEKVE